MKERWKCRYCVPKAKSVFTSPWQSFHFHDIFSKLTSHNSVLWGLLKCIIFSWQQKRLVVGITQNKAKKVFQLVHSQSALFLKFRKLTVLKYVIMSLTMTGYNWRDRYSSDADLICALRHGANCDDWSRRASRSSKSIPSINTIFTTRAPPHVFSRTPCHPTTKS